MESYFVNKFNDITGKTHFIASEYVQIAIAIVVVMVIIVWLMGKMSTASFSNYPLNSSPARFARSDRFTVQHGEGPEFTSVGKELVAYHSAAANAPDPSMVSEGFSNSKISENQLSAISTGL